MTYQPDPSDDGPPLDLYRTRRTEPTEVRPKPMTAGELRAILADAPDDAPVRVNLTRACGLTYEEGPAALVIDGEYLAPETWGDEAGVLIQIDPRGWTLRS